MDNACLLVLQNMLKFTTKIQKFGLLWFNSPIFVNRERKKKSGTLKSWLVWKYLRDAFLIAFYSSDVVLDYKQKIQMLIRAGNKNSFSYL